MLMNYDHCMSVWEFYSLGDISAGLSMGFLSVWLLLLLSLVITKEYFEKRQQFGNHDITMKQETLFKV